MKCRSAGNACGWTMQCNTLQSRIRHPQEKRTQKKSSRSQPAALLQHPYHINQKQNTGVVQGDFLLKSAPFCASRNRIPSVNPDRNETLK
jgi:hypothetical protein